MVLSAGFLNHQCYEIRYNFEGFFRLVEVNGQDKPSLHTHSRFFLLSYRDFEITYCGDSGTLTNQDLTFKIWDMFFCVSHHESPKKDERQCPSQGDNKKV